MVAIDIKRVYEPYAPDDGYRVLVDRLWPRGLTKERVHYDLWEKSIAPSTELRKAFGHDPGHWEEFKKKYTAELDANPQALQFARQLAEGGHSKVTLLYGARDPKENQAVVLQHWLQAHLGSTGASKG